MKIFLGETDIKYNVPNKYAFLNWRFDASNTIGQHIFGNFEMGKAYLSNAILTLYSIICSNNKSSVAASLIFPVLFNVWHGIELLLKSGITSISVLSDTPKTTKQTHQIASLADEFEAALKNIGMTKVANDSLSDLRGLINEFQKVNANFDFARYSSDSKGEMQFYNATYNDIKQWQSIREKSSFSENTIPNTCVDILVLFEAIGKILESFVEIVYYLTLCISEGENATDSNFIEFQYATKRFEDMIGDEKDSTNDDSIEKIMRFITTQVL